MANKGHESCISILKEAFGAEDKGMEALGYVSYLRQMTQSMEAVGVKSYISGEVLRFYKGDKWLLS